VHLAHDVGAVDDQRALARHAKRHVQHRPVLGDVDVVAAKHRVAMLLELAAAGQIDEQPERLVGDAVLRPVGVPAGSLAAEPLAPRRILREQLAQVDVLQAGVVRLERAIGGQAAQPRCHAGFSR